MGSAVAINEQTPLVPGTPADRGELYGEIHELSRKLDVANKLHAYGQALRTIERVMPGAHYYLMVLDPTTQEIEISTFMRNQQEEATEAYLEVEKGLQDGSLSDAVLVSAQSLDALRRAFPNYFLDTHVFIDLLNEVLAR